MNFNIIFKNLWMANDYLENITKFYMMKKDVRRKY